MAEQEAAKQQTADGLVVPRQQAEAARRRLLAAGLLAADLAPVAGADGIAFPLADSASDPRLGPLAAELGAAPRTGLSFPVRAAPPGDYRERLAHLDDETRSLLPRAHDVVGDIAILKLPDALLPHKTDIAGALLAARPGIRAVALDRGVKGEHRVRDLVLLAGAGPLATVHREHGVDIEVDLERTYFSPRLATERDRLLARIQPGARVLDLFAGVGALVVRVARERAPAGLAAIDVNPAAVALLRRNLERNRVPAASVDVREGDARVVAPMTADWDHVIMNLPHEAHRFLDIAARCVAPHGEVHLYAMLAEDDVARYAEEARRVLGNATGFPWRLRERRHVRAYAPTMDGWGFSLAAQG